MRAGESRRANDRIVIRDGAILYPASYDLPGYANAPMPMSGNCRGVVKRHLIVDAVGPTR
jgi:hypothetical protein